MIGSCVMTKFVGGGVDLDLELRGTVTGSIYPSFFCPIGIVR